MNFRQFVKSEYFVYLIILLIILSNIGVSNVFKLGLYHDDWNHYGTTIMEARANGYWKAFYNIITAKDAMLARPLGYMFIKFTALFIGAKPIIVHTILFLINYLSVIVTYKLVKLLSRNRLFAIYAALLIVLNPFTNTRLFWPAFGFIGGAEYLLFIYSLFLSVCSLKFKQNKLLVYSYILYICGIAFYNASLALFPAFLIYPIYRIIKFKDNYKLILRYIGFIIIPFLMYFIINIGYSGLGKNDAGISIQSAQRTIHLIGYHADRLFDLIVLPDILYFSFRDNIANVLLFITAIILLTVYSQRRHKIRTKVLVYIGIVLLVMSFITILKGDNIPPILGIFNRYGIYLYSSIVIIVVALIYKYIAKYYVVPVILLIFMIINLSTSKAYVDSYAIQRDIKNNIQNYIATNNLNKDNISIILSIDPPYVNNEAPIFDADWDLIWYLRYSLDSQTINAYPIYKNPAISEDGFTTRSLNKVLAYDNLYYYDYNENKITQIFNKEELLEKAKKYLDV